MLKYLLILILVISSLISCDNDEQLNAEGITISLLVNDDPDFFEKTVILLESKDLIVKTNFKTYINAYPFNVLGGYDEIKVKVISDTLNNDTLNMIDYLRKNNDSLYILAHHLEKGTCLMFSKKSNSIIKSVQVVNYSEGAPMQNISGRRFYVGGKLFLETVDSIS